MKLYIYNSNEAAIVETRRILSISTRHLSERYFRNVKAKIMLYALNILQVHAKIFQFVKIQI
jgi:hypothetical protein